MKTACIVASIIVGLVVIVSANLKAIADSVSEFDLFWEDDDNE